MVGLDAMLPQAHAPGAAPAGVRRLDVREVAGLRPLLAGVDVVCHRAALVGAEVRVGDLPAYAAHNDLGTATLLAAAHGAGVRRLVLASSMVVYGEGRCACGEHGEQPAHPRDPRAMDAGRFELRCPECGADLA